MASTETVDQQFDPIGAKFEEGIRQIGWARNILLATIAGPDVAPADHIKAIAILPPLQPKSISYGPWSPPPSYRVDQWPQERLGTPAGSYIPSDEDLEIAKERAAAVTGSFFEIRRPSWDFRPEGKDLIFVSHVKNPNVPNPSFDFISVDPNSKMFGRPTEMSAADIGFQPCFYFYSSHAWAYPRQELGKLALAEPGIPETTDQLAASVAVTEPGLGLELLTLAVMQREKLPESTPLEDFARAFDAQVVVTQLVGSR